MDPVSEIIFWPLLQALSLVSCVLCAGAAAAKRPVPLLLFLSLLLLSLLLLLVSVFLLPTS